MSRSRSVILTIVRHGQTQGNVNKLVEGVTDTPLNSNGQHQAQCAGEWLRNDQFEVVYTSDLKRASETASIIVEKNLNMQKSQDNFIELSTLRERDFGILEGVSITEYDKKAARALSNNRFLFTPMLAESMDDVKQRSIGFIKKICGITPPSTENNIRILVVTHGFVVAHLISYIYEETKCDGVPLHEIQKAWTNNTDGLLLLRMPNTAITRFEIEVDENTTQLKSATCKIYKSNEHCCN